MLKQSWNQSGQGFNKIFEKKCHEICEPNEKKLILEIRKNETV